MPDNHHHFELIREKIDDFKEVVVSRLDKINGTLEGHDERIRCSEQKHAKITTEFELRDEKIDQLIKALPKTHKAIRFWGLILGILMTATGLWKFFWG